MIIAADDGIPYLNESFSRLGEVRLFSGRDLRPIDVRDADALIVRTKTQVNASLLEGSRVRFVGTATIGTDHLDTEYLNATGIRFASAAGCNANAVAEYVISALLVLAERKRWNLQRKSLGVVGVGRIGSRVEKKAQALGMKVLLCDPPLRESTGDARYGFLSDVLEADVLTFHVPLTRKTPYPTHHMANREFFQDLSSRQYVLNSSRGAVVCNPHLKEALERGQIGGAVLDVWENEPAIDFDLLDWLELGTPHIAGYSLDGKVRGTAMIFEELCRSFGTGERWNPAGLFGPSRKLVPETGVEDQRAIHSVVMQAYDIRQDDVRLRDLKNLDADSADGQFDRLRDEYVFRPEFSHFAVELVADSRLAPALQVLGFETFARESG